MSFQPPFLSECSYLSLCELTIGPLAHKVLDVLEEQGAGLHLAGNLGAFGQRLEEEGSDPTAVVELKKQFWGIFPTPEEANDALKHITDTKILIAVKGELKDADVQKIKEKLESVYNRKKAKIEKKYAALNQQLDDKFVEPPKGFLARMLANPSNQHTDAKLRLEAAKDKELGELFNKYNEKVHGVEEAKAKLEAAKEKCEAAAQVVKTLNKTPKALKKAQKTLKSLEGATAESTICGIYKQQRAVLEGLKDPTRASDLFGMESYFQGYVE